MNETKSTRFQRLRRKARVWAWVSAGTTLAVVALSPASHAIESWARITAGEAPAPIAPLLALALFSGIMVAVWELAALPAVIYMAVRVEGAYSRTQTNPLTALASELPAAVGAFPMAIGVAAVVHGAMWVSTRWWWGIASAVLCAGLLVALHLGPALFVRFGALRPLARRSLGVTLSAVIEAAKVPVSGVYEWAVDRQANASALVTGVGRQRYVLLSSDLARTWSDDEVAVVVAHELAHHAHHDLWRATALDAVVLAVGLWSADGVLSWAGPGLGIGGPLNLAALPLIALVAGAVWLLATPVRRAQSREHERRADRFALACTGEVEAFGAAVRRLSAERLSEERPSSVTRWLFHRHPSVAERLAIADAFRKERDAV